MGSRLAVDVRDAGEVTIVTLAGVIDEDNDLIEITPKIGQAQVVVNTANIERINSCGVRDWVNWLSALREKGCTYHFVECSPAIMNQANAVGNFVGGGTIVSFFSPYFCKNCKKDKLLLVDALAERTAEEFHAPTCRCDECDQIMDFDDIESSYFAVISAQHREPHPVTPQVLEAAKTVQSRTGEVGTASPLGAVTTPTSGSLDERPRSPTVPGSSLLGGLLSESTGSGPAGSNLEVPREAGIPKWLLFIIAGLLLGAIVLMIVVVLRSL